jgi:phytoene dehydrogenase-like protein
MTAASLTLDWDKLASYANTIESKNKYPIVIIGAGLGGLCCGAYLSRFGFPITVVEQHTIPGGYATSFDRAMGKFTFEVSLKATCLQNNTTAQILKDLGILEKIQFIELPEIARIKGPNFEIPILSRNPESLITHLSKEFPEEKDGIRAIIQEMIGIAEESQRTTEEKRKQEKSASGSFPKRNPKMWNVRDKTLSDFINSFVKNPTLQNALALQWGSYGLPPSKLSAFYYSVAFGESLRNGSYYIKPRCQTLSDTLADTIESSGGKLLFDNLAEKILVKNGAVTGVKLSDGKILPARVVVSNSSALVTFKEMLEPENLPLQFVKKLDEYKPSISMFIVWLGLNKELRDKFKGYRYSVSSGLGPEEDYKFNINGNIEKGSFGVTFYDSLFKGYSKPGTSTLHITFLSGYKPWQKFETDYRANRKQAYNTEKARWTDILIKRTEKELIPGLSSMIEVKDSATPLTCWRYTRNTEGSIYGFEQSLNNAFMNRIDNKTPLKGLYLASAWGNPGGGYSGALKGGQNTFGKIIEDIKT